MTVKLTRSEMKSIVKECLVEILQEGLLGSLNESHKYQARQLTQPKNNLSANRPRSAALDTPIRESLKSVIKSEARGNPIMEDIFADTAEKTLPGMMSEGGRKNISLQEQFHGDPEKVFGDEAASKWALLAFSEPKNKIMT
jgi:hypothetical protein